MLCRRPESCTDHCAYHNRSDRFAAKHIAKFGSLIEDLIEADSHKIDEHEFHDRTQTARRCANGCSDEGRLGYGCIHDPISVFSIQPLVTPSTPPQASLSPSAPMPPALS